MITKKGINASPGVAIGPALVLDTEEYRIPRRTVEPDQIPNEVSRLEAALDASRQEVSELRVAAARKLGEDTAKIFDFHEAIVADRSLRENTVKAIEQYGQTAAYAFSQEMGRRQKSLLAAPDPYFRERVRDLADIEKRVLRQILGRAREDITRLTEPVVIVAHDITPSQALTLDRKHILGFAINVGGQTSHMAIIARMLEIPAVVALEDVTSDVSGGETVIVDGTDGVFIADADADTIAKFTRLQAEYRAQSLRLGELRDLPSITLDGARVELMANIELADEISHATDCGAEGIGLYRTEFLFLASERIPTEEQQYRAFRDVVERIDGRPVVIRTIDLGADKLSPHLGAQEDNNPDLGLRSLRYCLKNLDLFRAHLRAILRATAHGDVWIMFPMITTLLELRQAKTALGDVMEDLAEEGVPYRADVPIGIMVETPAAALMSGAFAREVSFISIGTNDLTQYTLAVDRSNERVAHLYCPHNPAVLRLVGETVRAANQASCLVNLCGEMAGSPLYTELLIGLGLRRLSMTPKDIPEVKKIVRLTTLERCRTIAERAACFDTEAQIHSFLRDELRHHIPEAH